MMNNKTALWALLVFALLLVNGYFWFQNQKLTGEMHEQLTALRAVDPIATNENASNPITREEIEAGYERIQVIEARALNYLGIFESIGLAITVLGVIGAVLGLLLGGGVREAQQKFLDAQDSMRNLEKRNIEFSTQNKAIIDSLEKRNQELSEQLRTQVTDITKKSNIAQFYVVLARTQAALGDFNGAIETYERARALIPENPVPYYHIGYILTQNNRFDEAEAILNKALEIDEDFANAKAALGFVSRRRWDKLFNEMEQKDSARTNENEQRLKLYAQIAKEKIEAALYTAPSLVDDDGESWHGSLGGLYRRQNNLIAAARHYQQATEVTPQSSYPLLNLSLIKWEQGNTEELLKELQKVHDLVYSKIKKDKDTYWDRADFMNVQLALGLDDDALLSLETFLQVLPVGARDVLPRVISSTEFILNAKRFPEDKRNPVTIQAVIEKLKAAKESREKEIS